MFDLRTKSDTPGRIGKGSSLLANTLAFPQDKTSEPDHHPGSDNHTAITVMISANDGTNEHVERHDAI